MPAKSGWRWAVAGLGGLLLTLAAVAGAAWLAHLGGGDQILVSRGLRVTLKEQVDQLRKGPPDIGSWQWERAHQWTRACGYLHNSLFNGVYRDKHLVSLRLMESRMAEILSRPITEESLYNAVEVFLTTDIDNYNYLHYYLFEEHSGALADGSGKYRFRGGAPLTLSPAELKALDKRTYEQHLQSEAEIRRTARIAGTVALLCLLAGVALGVAAFLWRPQGAG